MSVRDRAGINQHQKLFNLSGGPKAPANGQEFAQVIAEAAGLDGDDALAARQSEAFFGDDGFGFDDFLDLVNPLQHIPIVSSIYRELTGDTISEGARIFGGALYGGPIGLASAIGNSAVKQATSKDVGELALSAFARDLAAPTAQRKVPDYLDRMSKADKALLLSSIGLTPETVEKAAPLVTAPKKAQELFVRSVATPDTTPVNNAVMEWSDSKVPPGIEPNSPD